MILHNVFYVHLLKIKLIEYNGLSRDKAITNIWDYLQWAEKLKAQITYPSQVAYALFGGESKARKIVRLEQGKDPLQSVWGAAWDMLYLFIAQQYFPIKMSENMIFATNDEALWLIGSLYKLFGAVLNGGQIGFSIGEASADFPHYKELQPEIANINCRIKLMQISRMNKRPNLNLINIERDKLEMEFCKKYA